MKIKEIRLREGLSLGKISELTGISVPYLSEISHDKKTPSVEKAYKIASALNVTIEELMGYASDSTVSKLYAENVAMRLKLNRINKILKGD